MRKQEGKVEVEDSLEKGSEAVGASEESFKDLINVDVHVVIKVNSLHQTY